MKHDVRFRWLAALAVALITSAPMSQAANLPGAVYLVPNFHPACCGWLTDWSTERNYCANTYLDHLDRVRDDASYAFALSEVPNLLAILQFQPQRIEEIKQRAKAGRVELCNAFFLEPTINLSGGEALVKSGVEGLRWQTQVMGIRPRFAWMIDVTGMHEQMAQITTGLGLDALFYCRHNPTGNTVHWFESPDGTRALSISPGHYSEWGQVFAARDPLTEDEIKALLQDAQQRASPAPLTGPELQRRLTETWGGTPRRTLAGMPVLILAGQGDYNLAPLYPGYPTGFLKQWQRVAPDTELLFTTPGKYVDAILPGVRSGQWDLPVVRSGTRFSFNAFWIENMRAKSWFRRCEHQLQAAETLSTIASLNADHDYPVQPLYHAWLMLLLNMDRNSLWGSAGGMVFEHDQSWDVRDRYEAVEAISRKAIEDAMRSLLADGQAVAFLNPLNWERHDPVLMPLQPDRSFQAVKCQRLPDTQLILCRPALPSIGTVSLETSGKPVLTPKPIALPATIETRHYRAQIDPQTGALVSLKLKPSGREVLGGPANVIVAERPEKQTGEPGDQVVDREQRQAVANSCQFRPKINVTTGPLATTVQVQSAFVGGGPLRRVIRFYHDYPRIDFDTELNDIPDRTVVVAEFPLADDITEVRRGIPYGFSHGTWKGGQASAPAPQLDGWTRGIVPAVRWSHYALANGGGVALLDRGATGRELTERTPIIFLLNATDKYYGYPNAWLSGKGKHRLEYALVAHNSPWEKARIPQMAWEYNCPPLIVPDRAKAPAKSFVHTSQSVIVEAVRREGAEIELRLAECLGRPGIAELELALPHREAALTDLLGGHGITLAPGPSYRFPIRPQQIVTLRFRTDRPVEQVKPLLSWEPLVPEAKRAAFNMRSDKKGHPPRGDAR